MGVGGAVVAGACALLALAAPSSAFAQNITPRTLTAQIPRSGELWMEVAPDFQGWDQRFGLDGNRHPLGFNYTGSLASRLYPGIEIVAQDLNADAAALGYDSVQAGQQSLGAITMSELNREIRAIPVRIEFGILGRFSLEATVPVVWTKAEPYLVFDSAGATVASGANVLASPLSFFAQLSEANSNIQKQIASGQLTATQEAQARALIQAGTTFLDALRRRILSNDLFPLSGTAAGQQMLAYYAGLQSEYSSFGQSAPNLGLPDVATTADLSGFFEGPLLDGHAPTATVRAWAAGELEAGLRIGVLDGFEPDSVASGLQLRTTVGVLGRFPLRSGGALPYHVLGDFLGVPAGDGQRDVELTLYQDVRLGHTLELDARGSYGIQMADQLRLRAHPASRPFAAPSTAVTIDRKLGNYVRVRLAPRLMLDPHVLVGVEYRYWHKWADRYSLPSGKADPVVTALRQGTGETRQRLGFGVSYRPGGTESGAELGFIYQAALSGKGSYTPASDLATFQIRVPAKLF